MNKNKNNKNKIIRDDAQQNTYIDCKEKTCSSSGPKTKKHLLRQDPSGDFVCNSKGMS
jgi:5,10-methylene-tetrahydrofolate dehydrogenase/methenyl tetrahydrofolate cyclohydrolase